MCLLVVCVYLTLRCMRREWVHWWFCVFMGVGLRFLALLPIFDLLRTKLIRSKSRSMTENTHTNTHVTHIIHFNDTHGTERITLFWGPFSLHVILQSFSLA